MKIPKLVDIDITKMSAILKQDGGKIYLIHHNVQNIEHYKLNENENLCNMHIYGDMNIIMIENEPEL